MSTTEEPLDPDIPDLKLEVRHLPYGHRRRGDDEPDKSFRRPPEGPGELHVRLQRKGAITKNALS